MKKKTIVTLILTTMLAVSMLGCGQKAADSTQSAEEPAMEEAAGETADVANTEAVQEETAAAADTETAAPEAVTIGISQFAVHGSLDNCKEGFLEGLAEAGYVEGENLTVLFDNAQANTGTASTIADNYVSQGVDLICAIATPSAMSAYNSCRNTDIPVIYTAVSDPVAAGLADADKNPAGNITGTADTLPVRQQLECIREMLPEAKTIGILYTTSETNSESTIAVYKELAEEYGFTIVDSGINTTADVSMAAADLVTKVDCISNLTDNTVVSALQTVLAAANKQGIPVFGSEIEQVRNGCVAAMGLDYVSLGKQTGAMAAKVLKGEAQASQIPYEEISEASLYINTAAAEIIGMEITDAQKEKAAEVFTEIVVE